MSPLTLADHILFALIGFVLPLAVIWRGQGQKIEIPQDTAFKIRIYWLNSLVLWIGGLAVFILWLVRGRDFSALGIRWPVESSFPHWVLIVAVFVLLYFMDAVLSWMSDEEHPAAGILPANWKEFAHFGSVVSMSAGICEEIVFRGFMITYLLTFLAGEQYAAGIAIAGSSLVFGIAHEYQGGVALIKITLLSLLFGALFVLTKSVLLLILLHFSVDFCSGLIALLKQKSEKKLSGLAQPFRSV